MTHLRPTFSVAQHLSAKKQAVILATRLPFLDRSLKTLLPQQKLTIFHKPVLETRPVADNRFMCEFDGPRERELWISWSAER